MPSRVNIGSVGWRGIRLISSPPSRADQRCGRADNPALGRRRLRLIECVCVGTTIEQRLHPDTTRRAHPAANRDIELYRRLQASTEPIPDTKLRLDTDQPLPECTDQALSYLNQPLPTDPGFINAASRAPCNEATT
ncbi:MAG: hypothetical protein M3460_10985 [Actinomycetota bacterium]|nr:hypothetical protein [Actinomycetota bacterium]